MRILCVGSGARAEYLAAALIEANHSVSSVERVVDAAYLVAVEHIDAVVVLTLGDATDAARAMVARPAHTVLVIIDTPDNQDARVDALYAGADVCFTGRDCMRCGVMVRKWMPKCSGRSRRRCRLRLAARCFLAPSAA
jgi:two-component system, OmpR family, response regulator